MKKIVATLMLLMLFAIPAVPATDDGRFDSKKWALCHNEDGKFIEGPDCDPNSCGCLWHEIETFFKELF